MFRSIAHTGIRTRLLGGFAPICMLLAATVVYTVLVVSNISARIKPVVDRRAPIAIASTELVGNLAAAGSQLQTLATTNRRDSRGTFHLATERRSGADVA